MNKIARKFGQKVEVLKLHSGLTLEEFVEVIVPEYGEALDVWSCTDGHVRVIGDILPGVTAAQLTKVLVKSQIKEFPWDINLLFPRLLFKKHRVLVLSQDKKNWQKLAYDNFVDSCRKEVTTLCICFDMITNSERYNLIKKKEDLARKIMQKDGADYVCVPGIGILA